MITACMLLLYVLLTLLILYYALSLRIIEVAGVFFALCFLYIGVSWLIFVPFICLLLAMGLILHNQTLQTALFHALYKAAQKTLPALSKTEQEALLAGDTWLEKDLFQGKPNWNALRLVQEQLTQEEQDFLEKETHILCTMIDNWQVMQDYDLSAKAWDFLKEQGFLGLVIPKEYGGKGFSAFAHSRIVAKIASHSTVAAVSMMVPNSLGPGELLHHYGTEQQKQHYLPLLAKGKEIPCFALTEPLAGSDATAIRSFAIVVHQEIEGKLQLALQVPYLEKQWITLAPVATLIGLVLHVKDPQGLLKGKGAEGITCVLISRDTPNLEIGNRHLPAFQPFMNGTIRGKDLLLPIENIVGGQEKAGMGWKMLVECLSIGRAISLPALATGSSAVAYVSSSAFARVRKQFHVEIGHFEGIEEKLAEIAGLTYLINATRIFTASAVQQQKKPSVASAITKYWNTELARKVVNHAMDIHAGRSIVVGPRNYLMSFYIGLPISITVEGANVMTRNLLIFGQGALACHPYLQEELKALTQGEEKAFTALAKQHIRTLFQNIARSVLIAITRGIGIKVPPSKLRRKYQHLNRLSMAFALIADVTLLVLGGTLKRKERLSARLGDALSYLYMAMATLAFYEGQQAEEAETLHATWALTYCFYHAQEALLALCKALPSSLGFLLRVLTFPLGRSFSYPKDSLDSALAKVMMRPEVLREKIKSYIHWGEASTSALTHLEETMQALAKYAHLYQALPELFPCPKEELQAVLAKALAEKKITPEESEIVFHIEMARWQALQVDEFSFESMQGQRGAREPMKSL